MVSFRVTPVRELIGKSYNHVFDYVDMSMSCFFFNVGHKSFVWYYYFNCEKYWMNVIYYSGKSVRKCNGVHVLIYCALYFWDNRTLGYFIISIV